METDIADFVGRTFAGSGRRVEVFWVAVDSDRLDFCRRIKELQGPVPIVPVRLAARGLFDDPNCVTADLLRLFEHARGEIEAIAEQARCAGRIAILIVGKTDLRLPQTSCAHRSNMDSDSDGRWTAIPEEGGQ